MTDTNSLVLPLEVRVMEYGEQPRLNQQIKYLSINLSMRETKS